MTWKPKIHLNFSTLLFAGFSALSGTLLVTEFSSFRGSQAGATPDAAVYFTARLGPAVSARSINKSLMKCDRLMSPPFGLVQPVAQLQSTAEYCADFARRVIRWVPTHGYAYFIAAQSGHINGDTQARDRFLAQSQKFTPFEGWITERRVGLIANQISPDIATASGTFSDDVDTLLTTQSGAELLAGIYLHRATFRKILSQAATRASAADQTRFMNQLRKRQAVN